MQPFTSKQLYMMSGGNKLYIYKDGFGDVYAATPEEEAAWAQEVIANSLAKIETEENEIAINSAVENLLFHKYEGLHSLLVSKMQNANPQRKAALTAALQTVRKRDKSIAPVDVNSILQNSSHRDKYFATVRETRDATAKQFLLACLESDDHEVAVKATIVLEIWAYSGMPALRQNNLLGILQPENKGSAKFQSALEQLRILFQTTNNV